MLILLRRWRVPAVLGLALLVCAVLAQRRLAELDFEQVAEVLLENDEAIDGDEVFNKLTFVDDVRASVAAARGPAGVVVSAPSGERVRLPIRTRPDSRAPPASPSRPA